MDPNQTERLFRTWLKSLNEAELKELVAIDGKRVKGASKKGSKSILHMVSAWSSARGLILGQLKTHEKSNEITALPELINSLDITGAVITSDAMGCQTAIAQKIMDKGGDYVIGLKGNQGALHDEVINYYEQAKAVGFKSVEMYQLAHSSKHKNNSLNWLREHVMPNFADLFQPFSL